MLLAEVNFSQENVFAPAKVSNISSLMNVILPMLTLGAALICLVYGLYGAFFILTGGDSPEKIKKGQQTIIYSIIGLGIVFCAFVAVKLIGLILGVNNVLPI